MAEWITAIGTILAGVAAVAAVVLGVVTARAWRAQARAGKEAEVAGEALAAALQYTPAMRRMTLQYRPRQAQHFADAVHEHWEEVQPQVTALKLATGRAIAYLPDEAMSFLLELLKAGDTLRADQWAYAMLVGFDAGTPDREPRVFGPERSATFDVLERRAIAVLRPLARIAPLP